MQESDGFITVKSRKKQRGLQEVARDIVLSPHIDDNYESKPVVLRRIEAAKEDLASSGFYAEFFQILSNALGQRRDRCEVVCYGLGHFSNCIVARYQCALLLHLKERIAVRVSVYDPVFYEIEEEVLEHLGCNVIRENEEGKRKVDAQTIFFLPHCPKQLINNILWANWDAERLTKCVVIGSGFSKIVDHTPRRTLERSLGYILRVHRHTRELGVVNCFKYMDVFNDTSVHVFPESQLEALPEDFWLNCYEPKYQSGRADFITKSDLC